MSAVVLLQLRAPIRLAIQDILSELSHLIPSSQPGKVNTNRVSRKLGVLDGVQQHNCTLDLNLRGRPGIAAHQKLRLSGFC